MTSEEQDHILEGQDIKFLKRLVKIEAEALRKVGDAFGIYYEEVS